MNAADVVARRLHAAGCRHAFGIPGGEVLTLIDALDRAGVAFHLARHENAAGFMAEGVWRRTGAPGVLVATVGPGLANAFNVIANAQQDRVPLVALSGMIDPGLTPSFTHQVFDHGAALRAVVKSTQTLAAGAVGVQVDKALHVASAGRPGPVHLDLPVSLAAAEEAEPSFPPGPTAGSAPHEGPALDAARSRFARAERPILLAGLDVLNEPGGPEAVRSFVERHGIPLLTTYKAKGVLREDHPLCLGGHGLSPKSDAIVLPLLREADLVIAAGYDPIEMRAGWRSPWEPERAVEFAHAPNDHDMHHAAQSWVCSIAGGLAALEGAGRDGPVWTDGAPTRARRALDEAFAARDAWGPDRALSELLPAIPEEAVVTVDSGAHRILLSQMRFCRNPRQLLQSTGLCTMGCALPLALGAKIAEPERPVIAVMGDGCAEMVLGELATLRDSRLPVVVVVMVDRSLALIEMKQRREGYQESGVALGRTDFAGLGRLFGGRGATVSGPGEAAQALAEALAADRFSVIEIEIPARSYDGLI